MSTVQARREEVEAYLVICRAVADAVREAGPMGIPSGTVYAACMGTGMSIGQYERIIRILSGPGGVIRINASHLLLWVG